jgi:hypothetical protein
MHQLIGIALVVALILAVMPAPGGAAADDPNNLFPAAAVAVPNFISYRDRSRVADAANPSAPDQPSSPANTAEPPNARDPTGFLAPHPVGSAYDIGAYEH